MPTIPTLEEVCAAAMRLPCSPALLPRLVEVLEREDAPASDLEAIIALDPALAGGTLRLANSAYMSGGRTVDDLSSAILRLGQKEIYRLAALSLTSRWMTLPVEGYRWEPGDYCRHSFCVAVAAEHLATVTGRADPAVAYTAGLLHEIGKLAVAHACGEHFPAIRICQQEQQCTWLQAEAQVLGYDHAEVGGALLEGWRFSPTLVAAAAHLENPAAAPAEVLPIMAHVHAARYLATCMGAGVSEDGFLFSLNSHLLGEWGFTAEVLDAALPAVLDRVTKVLHDRVTHGAVTL
ncbi:MAG: HDOD domain-containing protein [Opitutae bacterium]|nr:HDOD domain-containing protein [Opitutae bacterium]